MCLLQMGHPVLEGAVFWGSVNRCCVSASASICSEGSLPLEKFLRSTEHGAVCFSWEIDCMAFVLPEAK